MRVPDENLDDFNVNSASKPAGPPPRVWLHFSGEIEVLKPLARWEGFAKSEAAVDHKFFRLARSLGAHRPLWFRHSLAVGGAVAIIALILGTGVYVGIYGPTVEPVASPSDVTIDQQPESVLHPPNEPTASDTFPTVDFPSVFDELYAVRSVARTRPVRPRVLHAAYRPPRRLPRPQLVVSAFIPTTLVIYLENGEIKTRIEPQLTAGYKKQLTLPN